MALNGNTNIKEIFFFKLKSILQNFLIFLTQFLADKIVYQSEYVKKICGLINPLK